ncbi:hypothetical protein JTB14_036540 [Gonioctena quinquepunctata]|nr:hypothetical protein JTB14_036540 [Gonioctena quinquepunctata]
MVNFKCCKTKPAPSYNIFHQACALRNINKIKFIEHHKVIWCEYTAEDVEQSLFEKSISEKTIEELKEDTEVKDRHIEEPKNNLDKFIDDALKYEDEMSELLKAQKNTILKAEKQIMELQKTFEQLKNKPTCTTSTQTALSGTSKPVATQTTPAEIWNESTQTVCNYKDEIKPSINTDNKNKKLYSHSRALNVT